MENQLWRCEREEWGHQQLKQAGLFTDSLSLIINYHYSFFLLPFFKWIKELRLRMLNNLSKIIHVMAVSGQVRSDTKPLPFTALLLSPLWSFLWFSQFRLNFYFSEFLFNVQPLWLAYLLVKYRDCVFMCACSVSVCESLKRLVEHGLKNIIK